MPLKAGSKVAGHYLIVRLHKLGSHGAVYLADHQALRSNVALKENLISEEAAQRQFAREAMTLANLRHPNIPRAMDYFLHEESQFIVMDWVEGENLADWITHNISPASELIHTLHGLFQALAYLHSLNPPIIHRDVEPSNVILMPNSKVVLVDFGFAKVFSASPVVGPRTDTRTDQYSLAATIYALLTRRVPVDALERATGREVLKPARDFNPDIPPHIDQALLQAMSISPNDRFPDVTAFWESLNREH